MASLEMDQYVEQGITVVTATGDINSATAHDFGTFLKAAINEADNGHVVLDMNQVYYMSSAGLRDIVSGLKIARRRGGELYLAGIQPRLKPVFEMVGLDSLSRFFDSVDDALTELDA